MRQISFPHNRKHRGKVFGVREYCIALALEMISMVLEHSLEFKLSALAFFRDILPEVNPFTFCLMITRPSKALSHSIHNVREGYQKHLIFYIDTQT